MDTKEIIITALAVALLVTFLTWMVSIGIKRVERLECFKWAEMSQRYESFYLTDWQESQCQQQFNSTFKGRQLLQRINASEK